MTNSTIRRINNDNPMLKNVFGELLHGFKGMDTQHLPLVGESTHPRVNITTLTEVEDGHEFTMEFALAGYSREEISSYFEVVPSRGTNYKVLTVVAEPTHEDNNEYITKEISKRKATRRVVIGINDYIKEARYVDGILYIVVKREDKNTDSREHIVIN